QSVSHESVRDRGVQERTEGIRRSQRDHPFPAGQTTASRAGEEDGEGAGRAERTQEEALSERRARQGADSNFEARSSVTRRRAHRCRRWGAAHAAWKRVWHLT